MKKLVQVILLVFITAATASAQPERGMRRPHGDRMDYVADRIHAAKLAYITDRLHISAEQAGNFVPLFDEYENELRGIRKAIFRKYKGIDPAEADDATSRQFIDDNLDYQQQVIDLKRRYNERFLKVLSSQQLSELYMADREFRQILMKRLEQRHGGRGR